jgi:hypothetical protein
VAGRRLFERLVQQGLRFPKTVERLLETYGVMGLFFARVESSDSDRDIVPILVTRFLHNVLIKVRGVKTWSSRR